MKLQKPVRPLGPCTTGRIQWRSFGRLRVNIFVLTFFILVTFPLISQNISEEDTDEQIASWSFLLVPVFETVFSGNVQWRPDWPADFPPDAFIVQHEDKLPEIIDLSNEEESFIVKRDSKGRLLEFPHFFKDGYAKVKADYHETGSLNSMEIALNNYSQEETAMIVTFPENFYPYSDLSPGGSFPMITVNLDDSVFFVFVFESPSFLTETWYDSNGNMLVYCKASVKNENGRWRIRSLQIHDNAGIHFSDFYFDSFGNTTEIRFEDSTFSSFFRNIRPVYWLRDNIQYELHWDTKGILTYKRASNKNGELITEYRYAYEKNETGNWIKQLETLYSVQNDLLVPQSLSSNTLNDASVSSEEPERTGFPVNWSRRIIYNFENLEQ